MLRILSLVGAAAVLAFVAACGETPQGGTAAEAKALLEKAVAEFKADKEAALAAFNSGQPPYTQRDLYVFCANASDGITTAHPTQKGQPLQNVRDMKGFAAGEEILKVATEDQVNEVAYMWPRPGSSEPVDKVSYVTKVGDQVCGVGYYK